MRRGQRVTTRRNEARNDAGIPQAEFLTARRARKSAGWVRRIATDPWRFFFVCLVLTFFNFSAWSIASPLFSGPDEPTQVVRAAAVVRGELVGSTIGSVKNATTRVTVPAVFNAGPPFTSCFAFHSDIPASCAHPIEASGDPVHTTTYAGRYPPLYYFIVGFPSMFVKSVMGLYVMRLMSALVNAVFVSLALVTVALWSRRRLLFVGVMTGVTPMVWFLGGVVNPSGLEICVAICLWVSGLVLVTEHADAPPPGLVAMVAFSAGVFMLVRPLSPLWVALIVVLLALAGGRRAVAALFASRRVRRTIAPLVACGVVAVWWIESEHSLDLLPVGARLAPGASLLDVIRTAVEHVPWWLHQMVGIFGALDTPSPLISYGLWALVAGVMCAVAFVVGRWRERAALLALVLCVLCLPVAIAVSQYHRLGIVWQGRDILPLAVGIPVLAVGIAQDSKVVVRWQSFAAVAASLALGVASIAAFLDAMRRYTVGMDGPLDFLHSAWHPPFGTLAIAGFAIVVVALLLWWAASAGRRPADRVAARTPSGAREIPGLPSTS